MRTLIEIYLFVGSVWFFLEWKESKNLTNSLIIGLFWVYEVFYLINKRIWKK